MSNTFQKLLIIDNDFITLLEAYYNNFIAAIQATSIEDLCYTIQALLHEIESFFLIVSPY